MMATRPEKTGASKLVPPPTVRSPLEELAETVGAAGVLAGGPEGFVAGAEGERRVEGRGSHGYVGDHAVAGVGDGIAGDGSGLPGGLRGEDADAAAAGGEGGCIAGAEASSFQTISGM